MSVLPRLDRGGGFSIDLQVRFDGLTPGQTILDTRDAAGKGLALTISDRFTLKLTLGDGIRASEWDGDPGTHAGTLRVGNWHHVVVTADGGPKIVTFVIDGVLNDGGEVRQYGWGRFDAAIGDVNGRATAPAAPSLLGGMRSLRVYTCALRTSEAVGNFHAATPLAAAR